MEQQLIVGNWLGGASWKEKIGSLLIRGKKEKINILYCENWKSFCSANVEIIEERFKRTPHQQHVKVRVIKNTIFEAHILFPLLILNVFFK
jgi:hypothetical protein